MIVTVKDFIYIQELIKSGMEPIKMHNNLIKYFNLQYLKPEQAEEIMTQTYTLLSDFNESMINQSKFPLINKFILDGIEYGLIPDFEDMTVGEWIDVDNYQTEITSINKLLSIFYRPLINKMGDKYQIEKYEGTIYSQEMLNADIKIYMGLMVFFYRLNNELIKGINTYIQKQK
jgi:hypothetical protein